MEEGVRFLFEGVAALKVVAMKPGDARLSLETNMRSSIGMAGAFTRLKLYGS